MSHELINTSAPAGIKPGSSGFCAVVMTANMPRVLEDQLMLLSGYRWLQPAGHPDAWKNPVSWAHWRVGGGTQAVLSRVCDAGFDYSQRSNRFSHHLVLDPGEQVPAGPAWIMRQPGMLDSTWDGEPRLYEAGRKVPTGENVPRVCRAWAQMTGDAGWAGVLVEAFLQDPTRPAYILFEPGSDMLALIDEAMALLPESSRWKVTFNTYFTDLPAGLTCIWRCCAAGTPAAREAPRFATSGVVIDLTRPMGAAPETPWCQAARTGEVPAPVGAAGAAPAMALAQFATMGADASSGDWNRPKRLLSDNDEPEAPPLRTEIKAPPMVSASASRAAPRVEAGGNKGLWVVAILWPLLAVGGVVGWHFHAQGTQSQADKQALQQKTDEWSTAARRVAELELAASDTQAKLDAATKGLADAQRERDLLAEQVRAALAKPIKPVSREADLDKIVDRLNKEKTALEAQVKEMLSPEERLQFKAIQTQLTEKDAKINGLNRQLDEFKGAAPLTAGALRPVYLDLSPHNPVVSFAGIEQLGGEPQSVKLISAGNPPEGLFSRLSEPATDWEVAITPEGGGNPATIVSFKVRPTSILVTFLPRHWPNASPTRLSGFLKTSVLRVTLKNGDVRDFPLIVTAPKSKFAFDDPNSQKTAFLVMLSGEARNMINLAGVGELPEPWTLVTYASGRKLTVRHKTSEAEFDLELENHPTGGGLRLKANYGEAQTNYMGAKLEAEKEKKRQDDAVYVAERDIKRFEAAKDQDNLTKAKGRKSEAEKIRKGFIATINKQTQRIEAMRIVPVFNVGLRIKDTQANLIEVEIRRDLKP